MHLATFVVLQVFKVWDRHANERFSKSPMKQCVR